MSDVLKSVVNRKIKEQSQIVQLWISNVGDVFDNSRKHFYAKDTI